MDPTGRLEGRGAYVCAERSCWDRALKRSAVQRALRTALPDEVRTQMEQGDVAAMSVTTHGTPSMITGGTHGT
jgi:predicted RNA-binding protein YlxR (DUF448 family)